MSRNDKTPQTARPYASETAIREMYDKAAGHRVRAADLEATAVEVVRTAERTTAENVNTAQQNAAHYVEQAERTAAEMVRKAREQADADVQKALQQAAADMREAEAKAGAVRTELAAETEAERYWSGLAAQEAAHAGLASATQTLTDGQLNAAGAAS